MINLSVDFFTVIKKELRRVMEKIHCTLMHIIEISGMIHIINVKKLAELQYVGR